LADVVQQRLQELIALFGRTHEVLYGAGAGNVAAGVEGNGLRVDAVGPAATPALQPSAEDGAAPPVPATRREVYLGERYESTPVYRWAALRADQSVPGPAVIESEFTTVLVPHNAAARLDAYGNVVLTLHHGLFAARGLEP
jgi:N-methylhydantoinase A